MYIGHVEKVKKPITDESNDHGHIDETAPQIIRYVAACEDHKFMLEKTMQAEGSVTYSVFHPPAEAAEGAEGAAPEGGEGAEAANTSKKEDTSTAKAGAQAAKQPQHPHKFIPDATKESKLKFFRVPKLGCFLAVSLKYNSCLYDTSLDKAVDAYYETIQQREKQAKEIQEHEEKVQQEKEEKEGAGEVYQPAPVDWPKIEEPPYVTQEREYVLCLDTLGQDRYFSEAEKEFALDIAKHVIACWEASEREALTKDKNLRIAVKTRDDEYKEKELVEVNEAIDKAGEEAAGDEAL